MHQDPRRTAVTLDDGSVRVLTAYRDVGRELLAFGGADLSPDACVVSHRPNGVEPWRPNYVTLAFGRLARRHGLHGLRLHDLRHFAATTMLTGGVDVRTAAGRLGHAQSSTTLDMYAHFVQLADQRAAAAMGAALDTPPANPIESSPDLRVVDRCSVSSTIGRIPMVTRQSFNRRTAEPQSAFITVREAARQLGIGEGLAYRMANQCLASRWASGLPCVRFGRRLLVSRTEMARLVRIKVSAAS